MQTPGRGGVAARVLADQRFRYLVVGGGTAVVELASFTLLLYLGLQPAAANATSFCIAVVVNFAGYRLWSFAGDHGLRGHTQFVAFTTLALVNVAITSFVVHRLSEGGMAPLLAKLGCMVMVTLWNYVLLNRVIFARSAGAPDAAAQDQA